MTTTIRVSRALCSPVREDVLTATLPYGVKIFKFRCQGWGRYPFPNKFFSLPEWVPVPDRDIWARRHTAHITVSDDQAAWAERLLWQSNKVMLDSPPLNKGLQWKAPPACTAGPHGTLGRGDMPIPWSEQKSQPRAKAKKATKPAQPAQRKQSRRDRILDFFLRF